MKTNLLILVLSLYASAIELETKNVNPVNFFINQLNEKGLDFDKNNQSCKIYKDDLPFAMCQDFLDFLKTARQKNIRNMIFLGIFGTKLTVS